MILSMKKIEAMKRIKKEYRDINMYPISNLGITAGLFEEDDIFNWFVTILGPKDTSYSGGLFYLRVIFPEDYPNSVPDIIFLTPIYHLNVNPYKTNEGNELGHLNIKISWKPEITARQLLTQLAFIIYNPNPDNAYELDRVIEYKFKRALYEEKAKYFTKKYANPLNGSIRRAQRWDFSYYDEEFIPYENPKVKEIKKEPYEQVSNDNEKIIIGFDNNGINKIYIECKMNELTIDVIQRCVDKLGISKNIFSDDILFLYNKEKINFYKSIRNNGFCTHPLINIVYELKFA